MTSVARVCRKCGTTTGPFVVAANLCVICKRAIERDRARSKKDIRSAQNKLWRAANREALAASKAEYHRRNRDKIVSYCREWREKNGNEYNARRAAARVCKRHPRSALLRDHPDPQWRAEYARALGRLRHARERDKDVAHSRAYYRRNKQRFAESNKAWREANRERYQIQTANRRARKLAAGGRALTVAQWREVLAIYGHACAYCHATKRITVDHVIPLSRGGEHTQENVVPACGYCNGSKNARTPLEWFMGLSRPMVRRKAA